MNRMPRTAFSSVSIDLIKDTLGEVPQHLALMGVRIRTILCRSGRNGRRPLFACPRCERAVLLMLIPSAGGTPACRACWRTTYPSEMFHRSPLEKYLTKSGEYGS